MIDTIPLTIQKNILHRYSKRDKGELYDPFEILPLATTKLYEKVMLFSDASEKSITFSYNFVVANGSISNGSYNSPLSLLEYR